jgi:hypothetical protein
MVGGLGLEGSLPMEYSDYVEEFFLGLYEALGYGQDIEENLMIKAIQATYWPARGLDSSPFRGQ